MADRFDVVIIGGGNAGLAVAAVAHGAGKRVAIIEEWDFGGTCPNRGCTPKKVLVAAAHVLDEIERAGQHGIEVGETRIDWAKLIDREKDMIAQLPGAMENVACKRGELFKGHARFVAPNTIDVDGTLIEGDNIVIATGSKPRSLPIAGAQYLITSDDVLSERTLPKDIVFIGGGVIAMEFSHVYARAGANVTILEMLPGILPRTDRDAVAAIQRESERIGISIRTGVTVKEISKVQGRLRIRFEHEGREQTLDVDRAVNGAGRVANVDGLDLAAGNVKHDGIRIETDPFLRSTSNPAVWVIGDALVSSAQLSPLATYEGQIVGRNIVDGPSIEPDYTTVPSGIYTVPALSSVGLTEEEARERGLEVRVTTNDMTGWFSAKTYAETAAWAKTIVEERSDRIVGAHLVGHRGEELIHLFALAMRNDISVTQIKETMFAFPTFSADIKSML